MIGAKSSLGPKRQKNLLNRQSYKKEIQWIPGVLAALILVGLAYIRLPPTPIILQPETLSQLETGSGANLAADRNDFTSAAWHPENLTAVKSAGVAPDGSTTAIRLTETANEGRHRTETTISGIARGGIHTLSVYAKQAQRGCIQLEMRDDPQPGKYGLVQFDLEQKSAFGDSGDIRAASVQELPGDWVRCWAAMRYSSTQMIFNVSLLNQDGARIYLGDGASGVLVWGVQFEPGDRPKGYNAAPAVAN